MPSTFKDVPCPFCGLACDDLTIVAEGGRLSVAENGCPRAIEIFRTAEPNGARCRVGDAQAAYAEAVQHAARMLADARAPLFSGMATDVAGVRAALCLADRVGGIVDHANSRAAGRNMLGLQDSGWMTTTLAEVANRADLILLAGTDAVGAFPRFFQRHVLRRESIAGVDTKRRDIVFLGKVPAAGEDMALSGHPTTILPCDLAELGEVVGALRCLLAGRELPVSTVAGIEMSTLRALAARMQKAAYGVVVWAAGDLAISHAELTTQALCGLVRDLNRTTRYAGLPLGGNDGDLGANQVATWQTGYPLPVSLRRGYPEYDPHGMHWDDLVARGEADLLVWVSSLSSRPQIPDAGVPTIVLAPPGTPLPPCTRVYFPVGIPGIDHAGHFIRTDSVVTMRLKKLREGKSRSVAQVLTALNDALPAEAAAC